DESLPFDGGVFYPGNVAEIPIREGTHYSFRVTAINRGGESFPSETVSLYKVPAGEEKGTVLIVNGFTRVSAPDSFASEDTLFAGFVDQSDYGVPYLRDISYIGSQYEFRRKNGWADDDAPGFGASNADWETKVIPGNTFDYPLIHGKSFAREGYSYVSSDLQAFIDVDSGIDPRDFFAVDLILGKQKQVRRGGTAYGMPEFKAFPEALQIRLTQYASQGGNMIISGAYVASDLWEPSGIDTLARHFARETLNIRFRSNHASKTGEVMVAPSPYTAFYKGEDLGETAYSFRTGLNL
ncbi:MAG TPA: xanthan lyase, partial [Rikenellaceae bacterium]|nr:xanthan lyase [Rikenellaceae bacterium]